MTRAFVPAHGVDEVLPACRSLLEQAAELTGPGSNRVRSLMRRLVLELELRAQDERRLNAEVLRSRPRLALPRRRASSAALLHRPNAPHALVEECRRLVAELAIRQSRVGFSVQAAARQLLIALELYEQDQLRLDTESLRQELASATAPALLLPSAHAPEEESR